MHVQGERPLPTYLPGAYLSVRGDAGGEVVVQGARNSARLLRSNILLCKTVVHVVDTVGMFDERSWGMGVLACGREGCWWSGECCFVRPRQGVAE